MYNELKEFIINNNFKCNYEYITNKKIKSKKLDYIEKSHIGFYCKECDIQMEFNSITYPTEYIAIEYF